MLLLFENTLIHYIYIVFYTLISWAHHAYNLGNFYAMSRHATPAATPSPRSKQLHAMSNHTPNSIRVPNLNRFRETDGRTLVTGWNASRREPCAHGASRIPSPLLGCA